MTNTLYLFDLDNTLFEGDSSTYWSEYLVREGLVNDAGYLQQEARLMADYAVGKMDIHAYVALTLAPLAMMTKEEVDRRITQWVTDTIMPRVYPQARDLIQTLRARQQQMMIISASVSLLVKPVARALGIDHATGVDLRIDNGHYSNVISGTPSYQQGKVTRLREWLAMHPQRIGRLVFYTDSINDLPLCLVADEVVLVNPCPQLLAQGERRLWPVVNWAR
ncbi:phosphoserine phosphatase [Trabulsiella guamensis ATCC 49490]|uniref:Phosphoserine phosphatase n=1 Tax=Trabulsiella guamensis ATCC 49490 TaxID=1005994 RepID=A0A084ZKR7_9ENTR|nr:HAD family hydrolase [Trabulsiella guamensis]KFB98061.1 phosphoserine phosphatase [Trabulsiella guamensis ATCC 49490]